ncbi:glutathione peroxidase [Lachnobacterium bovis DSM 14045]|uniref:Glutathione peroxidase n=2 Tax=Lachnobacterium bovis TaxID=140626 RepID=A0A1H3LDD8_9FIRM|nr:glutathione peroxidase [Lachnobacterium bovis]SDY62422.1 glutathione peroxidase [Lachnobacterium bovis DSM 14045]
MKIQKENENNKLQNPGKNVRMKKIEKKLIENLKNFKKIRYKLQEKGFEKWRKNMGFYDLSVTNVNGEEVKMSDYKGKVVMVVNTATGCGFTPHYEPMEAMYEKYHDAGFEIIDVPCNQFAGQTPGTDEEIHEFCTLKYNTQFPQMKKSDVNGENAIELFKFLKEQKGFEGFGKGPKALAMGVMLKKIDKDYKNNSEIKWNFTKFVINRKGEVVARFEPTADMNKVEKFVEQLISEK